MATHAADADRGPGFEHMLCGAALVETMAVAI